MDMNLKSVYVGGLYVQSMYWQSKRDIIFRFNEPISDLKEEICGRHCMLLII
jgi:hypothetical protein